MTDSSTSTGTTVGSDTIPIDTNKTYLFSYKPGKTLTTFKLSDHIKIPPWTTSFGIEYNSTFMNDVDDIFNVLCSYFENVVTGSDGGGEKEFDGLFRMFLIANLWSDPYLIGTLIEHSFSRAENIQWSSKKIQNNEIATWLNWISKDEAEMPTSVQSYLRNKTIDLGTGLGSTITIDSVLDSTLTTEMSQFRFIRNTSTISKSKKLRIVSNFMEGGTMSKIVDLLHQFIVDSIEQPLLENSVQYILEDLRNRYGWYKGQYNEILLRDRIVSEILISRTYQLDSYTSLQRSNVRNPGLRSSPSIESRPLERRYEEAISELGISQKGRQLRTLHNLSYVSFWNRIDYLNTLFESGSQRGIFKNVINTRIQVIVTHVFLLYLLPFIATEWLPYLEEIVRSLDSIRDDNVTDEDKTETVWRLVHSILIISLENPLASTFTMNSRRYYSLDIMIEIISSWGWKQWFVTDPRVYAYTPSKKEQSKNRLGFKTSYVPFKSFVRDAALYMEDMLNKDPTELKGFLDKIIVHYSPVNIRLNGLSMLEIESRAKTIPSPITFGGTSKMLKNAREGIIGLYNAFSKMVVIIRGVSVCMKTQINLQFGTAYHDSGRPLDDVEKLNRLERLFTTINMKNSTQRKTLQDMLVRIDQVIRALNVVNNNTVQFPLEKIPKTFTGKTMLDVPKFLEEFVQSTSASRSRRRGQTTSDLTQIIQEIDNIKLQIQNKFSDWVQRYEAKRGTVGNLKTVYEILVAAIELLRTRTKEVVLAWEPFFKWFSETLAPNRTHTNLFKNWQILREQVPLIQTYFGHLRLTVYGNGDGSYESDLQYTDRTVLELFPYLTGRPSSTQKIRLDYSN
jgi:hypothetical protein